LEFNVLLCYRAFSLIAIATVLQAQESQAEDRTFGWDKAGLYMTRSDKRPFRIFLDPEMDFSPWGTYLPEWVRTYPPKQVDWDFTKRPRFHVQSNQLRVEGSHIHAYIVREMVGQNPPFEQWFCVYDRTTASIKAVRYGLFSASGEPVEFSDYSAVGGLLINPQTEGWAETIDYLRTESARQTEAMKSFGVISRASDFLPEAP